MATVTRVRTRSVAMTVRGDAAARLARETGLHPELVDRLVRLGFADPEGVDAAARLARAVRLRRDLGLNYAGAVLACELLARIDDLQDRLRRYER
jgi:hypothetical protein